MIAIIFIILFVLSLAANGVQWIALKQLALKVHSEDWILSVEDELLTPEQVAKKNAMQKPKDSKYKIEAGGQSADGKVWNWSVRSGNYVFFFKDYETAKDRVKQLQIADMEQS